MVFSSGDTVSHPVDGAFRIEDVEPPHGVWHAGRVKRVDGRWYPAHTVTRLAARYKCGTEVNVGDNTTKGVVTWVDHSTGRLIAADSRITWPADMVCLL